MKSLYITSVERYSGKTAVCLALGKRFQSKGYQVGYMKPLSLQPWLRAGRVTDEDAVFVKETLGLRVNPAELSPVVVTEELLSVYLTGQESGDLMPKVKTAYQKACQGKDILLLEGGGSLREGYFMGLPTPQVARELNCQVLVIVRYRDKVHLLDDMLASSFRLGEDLAGVIINRVPEDDKDFVHDLARPFLESRGITIFGVLPEVRGLAALTVEELVEALDAQVLTPDLQLGIIVENLTIGAMTADAALRRMRKQRNKAVITGGDRTDIQLAALETSTSCLVLTGNLQPRPLIIKQATELGVPVLLVRENTMEAVDAIDRVYGKTRLGHSAKLKMFQDLLDEHLNWDLLSQVIGV